MLCHGKIYNLMSICHQEQFACCIFLENCLFKHPFTLVPFFLACLHLPSSSYCVTLNPRTLKFWVTFSFSICKACFRQNITVVTIYASLGEEALCHSLNEVSTVTSIVVSHAVPACYVFMWSAFLGLSRVQDKINLYH